MQTLTSAIVIENVNRFKVTKCRDFEDDTPPRCEVVVTFYHLGTPLKEYQDISLDAYDTGPLNERMSTVVVRNQSASANVSNKLERGMRLVQNAYTLISAANKTVGNRAAKLLAVEVACKGTLIDTSLAST